MRMWSKSNINDDAEHLEPKLVPTGEDKNIMWDMYFVTPEELREGAIRKLILHKNVICGLCNGQGGKEGAFSC